MKLFLHQTGSARIVNRPSARRIFQNAAAALLSTAAFAADMPPAVAAAKKKYDASVEAATKPLRDRYLQELRQMKSRALALKNLDEAIAIDAEIKRISAEEDNFADRVAGGWIWSQGKTLNLQADGTGQMGEHSLTWKVTGPATIEYTWSNGHFGTIDFEPGLKRATIHQTSPSGKKADLQMVRVKD
jgi:hypothetical protein